MGRVSRVYQWVDILSLDVVAGAAISAMYFSALENLSIPFISFIALGLAVWIIYTADHLKDVSRLKLEPSTARHKFHQKHFKLLYYSLILAGLMEVLLLFNLDKYTLLWGLKLSALILIYLVISHYLSYAKEFIGGLLYCAGIMLPTISQLEDPIQFITRVEVIIFSLLVIINLLIFSRNELSEDIIDNHNSFALRFGRATTLIIIKTLMAVVAVIMLLKWNSFSLTSSITFILMELMLIAIIALPKIFEKNDRYRYWGDIIFLFPALALLG